MNYKDRTNRYWLQRLREQRPDLLSKVESGEQSISSVCIEAGWQRRRVPLPIDVNRAAEIIKRHFSPDELEEISALLENTT